MLTRNHNESSAGHQLDPSLAHHSTPHRPQRAKRPLPDPSGSQSISFSQSVASSFAQLSFFDDHTSTPRSSLPSSPSTVSLASSTVDARQLESGVDLQESPRPVNRRSNRDFRIIPADEIEVMNEVTLQDSIRHSQTPPRRSQQQHQLQQQLQQQQQQQQHQQQKQQPHASPAGGVQEQSLKWFDKSPILELNEDEEESYFGDILDKYCNSDDESTSSPAIVPMSTTSGQKAQQTTQPAQLLTPPSSRSSQHQTPTQTPAKRGSATASSVAFASPIATLRNSQSSSSLSEVSVQGRHRTSSNPSLLNTPSTRLSNNMYQHTTPIVRNSTDSLARAVLSLASPSLSPSPSPQPPAQTSTTPTARTYAKKPPPPPKDDNTTTSSSSPVPLTAQQQRPPSSASSTSSKSSSSKGFILGRHFSTESFLDHREAKPEPPPKDSSRRQHQNNVAYNIIHGDSHAPKLSLDTHHSEGFDSFADVVEATMNRHRSGSSSSAKGPRRPSNAAESTPLQTHAPTQPPTRPRTGSAQGPPIVMPQQGIRRGSEPQPYQNATQNGWRDQRHGQKHENEQMHGHGQGQGQEGHAPGNDRRRPSKDSSSTQNQQQQRQPFLALQEGLYRMHGSTSQLDLSGTSFKSSTASTPSSFSRASNQSVQFLNERARSYSQGSISPASPVARQEFSGYSRAPKPVLIKTPIARARAREARGIRKVNFGEMITIVKIDRADSPPPAPVLDKKARKKLLQAKKNALKEGKGYHQNFDPEYNAAYFNAPYTPTSAEVVVTLAPWIGNPNYDEEKQNSKFYYDDDYDNEYDDDEYEAPFHPDIRLGPEDEDLEEEDLEEEEEEEDDEDAKSRPWGNGIAGPSGRLPKKKGGMFKFKRAVNKLLRN